MKLLERFFAKLTTKGLRRGVHRSVADLTVAVERWMVNWSEDQRAFVWPKTADQFLNNLAGFLNHIPDSGH